MYICTTRYRRTEEERVRCFLMRNVTSGMLVSQSSDATCHAGQTILNDT